MRDDTGARSEDNPAESRPPRRLDSKMLLGLAPSSAGMSQPRGLKIAALLAREIVQGAHDGGLQPGDQLGTEPELLERYDVSRASLREALRILEVLGLINIRVGPRGGPRIREVQSSDFARTLTFYLGAFSVTFRMISEARAAFEPAMARMATDCADEQMCSAFRRLVEHLESNPRLSPREHLQTSREFHHILGRMAANPMLVLMSEASEEIFAVYENDQAIDTESIFAANLIHSKIGRAVLNGDGDLAESLMRTHLVESARDMERRYPAVFDAVPAWSY